MKRFWLFPIVAALCLIASAVASAAEADSDEDGQTLAARPGMARVYLIQGFIADGPFVRDSATDGKPDFYISDAPVKYEGPGVPTAPGARPGSPTAMGVLGGAAIAALLQSPRERPATFTHTQRYTGNLRYYLGDKKLGETKESQYVAVDLAPGRHDIRLDADNGGPIAPLSLAAGDVVYLIGDFDLDVGLMFEVCRKECGDMIKKGHRVPAFPKPGSNIPNF